MTRPNCKTQKPLLKKKGERERKGKGKKKLLEQNEL